MDLGPESPACGKANERERTGWCVTKGKSRNGMSSGGEGANYTIVTWSLKPSF